MTRTARTPARAATGAATRAPAVAIWLLLSAAVAPAIATADPLPARDSADLAAPGHGSIGVVAPLRHAVSERLELEVHPLGFLLAPHVTARLVHRTHTAWRITGAYGLSFPTPAMKFTRTYLFPTDGTPIPWYIVPSLGAIASHGARHVLSVRADLAAGLAIGDGDPEPLDTYAPLELLFAPALFGYRANLGVDYDRALTPWLRARASLDAYFYGDRFAARAALELDLRLTRRTRLSAGASYWDSDQHAIDADFQPRRSHDLYPLFDVIYAY